MEELEDWPCRWDYEFGRAFMRRKTGWRTFALVLVAVIACEGHAARRAIATRVASLRVGTSIR